MGEWDVAEEKKLGEWSVMGETPLDRPTSTITGKPLLTAQERLPQIAESLPSLTLEQAQARRQGPAPQEALEGLRKHGPTIGDIGGTLLAPQFKIAAKGVPAVAKLGKMGLNLLSRAASAGAGAGGMELAGQLALGEEFDPLRAGQEAGLAAGGEIGMGVLGATAKGMMRAASALTPSGAAMKEGIRKGIINRTADRAVNFIKDLAPPEIKAAGARIDIDDLGISIREAFDETKVIYNAYGRHVDEMARMGGGRVYLPLTAELLSKKVRKDIPASLGKAPKIKKPAPIIREKYGWAKNDKQSLILRDFGHPGFANTDSLIADDVNALIATMFKKGKSSDWSKLTATQRANREKLKEVILTDIRNANPEAVGLKELGDKQWRAIAQFNKLNKLFNKGVNTMPSGDKYLNPTKLANEIYASKGMIEEQFGKDMWKTLKAEADFYKKMSPYWRPPSSKSVLQKSAEGMGRMAVPTTLAFTHPVLIPVVEGFGAISSWALTGGTDKKILKQMTRYLVKPAAKTGLHMAGNPLLF